MKYVFNFKEGNEERFSQTIEGESFSSCSDHFPIWARMEKAVFPLTVLSVYLCEDLTKEELDYLKRINAPTKQKLRLRPIEKGFE